MPTIQTKTTRRPVAKKKAAPNPKPVKFDAPAIKGARVDARTDKKIGVEYVGDGGRVFTLGDAQPSTVAGKQYGSTTAARKRIGEALKNRPTLKALDCYDDDVRFECDFEQFMLTMYALAHEAGITVPANPHA